MQNSTESSGLDSIWSTVQATDPAYTKAFTKAGGFSGTAINATYLAKRATEAFGPIGIGWGVSILEEKYQEGAPLGFDSKGNELGREIIHILRVELWYMHNDKRGSVIQFGQTTFVGKNKYGCFTDEEAPKKSLTDGMSKCLSLLGFGADVHMGLYDDNKYVASLAKEFGDDEATRGQEAQQGSREQHNSGSTLRDEQQNRSGTQQQNQPQSGADNPQLSDRYMRYRERIKQGQIEDVKTARGTVQSDPGLSELEKALLLSSPELQLAETKTAASQPGDVFL